METGTKDKEGAPRRFWGKVTEVAGMISDSPRLGTRSAGEQWAGKVKIGQYNKFVAK